MEAFNLIIVELKFKPQVQSLPKFANKNIVAWDWPVGYEIAFDTP